MTNVKTVAMIVSMSVKCAKCGLNEDETFELDMPRDNARPLEELVPGKCSDCGAPIRLRWQRVQ